MIALLITANSAHLIQLVAASHPGGEKVKGVELQWGSGGVGGGGRGGIVEFFMLRAHGALTSGREEVAGRDR